jgi:hypothetical protein
MQREEEEEEEQQQQVKSCYKQSRTSFELVDA